MSSTASRALVTDFDGTLVRLAVDWHGLRARLGVTSIAELVQRGDAARLATVAQAESGAARSGEVVQAALRYVRRFDVFAILSNNSEAAVRAFLERDRELARRCRLVLGRETHGQRKHDAAVFAAMIERCATELEAASVAELVYLGDEAYELELAAGLGLRSVDVASLR